MADAVSALSFLVVLAWEVRPLNFPDRSVANQNASFHRIPDQGEIMKHI